MPEEITININSERDKIKGIDEYPDIVILNYEKNEQIRPIEIPRKYIDYVNEVIEGMEVGRLDGKYKSVYIYNKCIHHFKIESNIVKKRMEIISKVLKRRNINEVMINGILDELKMNNEFALMDFAEFIGTRKIENSDYFKIYGAIRYWAEKKKINYNKLGYIVRVI